MKNNTIYKCIKEVVVDLLPLHDSIHIVGTNLQPKESHTYKLEDRIYVGDKGNVRVGLQNVVMSVIDFNTHFEEIIPTIIKKTIPVTIEVEYDNYGDTDDYKNLILRGYKMITETESKDFHNIRNAIFTGFDDTELKYDGRESFESGMARTLSFIKKKFKK